MAGMLQIITYLLCFYLVVKGIEIVSINAQNPSVFFRALGGLTLLACIIAAVVFANMQDTQAQSLSSIATPTP